MTSIYKIMHTCIDKPAYSSIGEAVRTQYKAILRKQQFDPRIHPYVCPFGNHIHLGKTRIQCQNS